MQAVHSVNQQVSFGDCDPAGIVFYPNVYAWFDRAFHDWLRPFGGHAALCRDLGAIGIGLMEAHARFLRPMRDGDILALSVSIEDWGRKTLRLAYEGRVGAQTTVTGTEVRGLFRSGGSGIVAAEIQGLREVIQGRDEG